MLAIKEPNIVRTLVLAEPPVITLFLSNTPKISEILKLLATRPRTAASIIKMGTKGFEPAKKAFKKGDMDAGIITFINAVLGTGGYKNLTESQRAMVKDNTAAFKAELLGSGFVPLKAKQLQNIQIPTLLVNGQQSIPLFHHLSDRLEELIPNTKRYVVPDALHNMHHDNPSAYNSGILSSLLESKPGELPSY
jgi:pimeloyl-ACP methyl ester carboxylesterase